MEYGRLSGGTVRAEQNGLPGLECRTDSRLQVERQQPWSEASRQCVEAAP